VAGLGAGFLLLEHVRWGEPLGLDQGLFACFGRWVPRGWLPYRDIWDSKPPGVFYTYTLAFRTLGEGAGAIWTFEALWVGATALVLFLSGRRAWGGWEGLTSAFFFVFFLNSPAWGGFWARAQAEVFLCLPVALGSYFALAGRPFLAGTFTGIASLYKIPALFVALGWPVLWLGKEGLPRKLALMSLGVALPWTVVLVYFWAEGSLDDLVEAIWTYSRQYAYVAGRGHSFAETVWKGVVGLILGSPVVALFGAVGIASSEGRMRWLGPWLFLSFLGVVVQRQLAGYHFLLAAPPLALASGRGLVRTVRWTVSAPGVRKLLPASFLVACAVLLWAEGGRWKAAYGQDWEYRAGKLSRETYLEGFDRGPFSPSEQERIAGYIRRRTSEGDVILVWGLSPGIYFLSKRKPATKYPFHHLLLTESPLSLRLSGLERRREEFLEGLEAEPPAYILVGVMDPNGFEPLDSYTQMLRFPRFHRFVSERYRYETRIGHFLLFRRVK